MATDKKINLTDKWVNVEKSVNSDVRGTAIIPNRSQPTSINAVLLAFDFLAKKFQLA